MKELSALGIQRIVEISKEARAMLSDVMYRTMYPNPDKPVTFDELSQFDTKLREIEQWAEAIDDNEENEEND